MAGETTHDANIVVTITLDARAQQVTDFGKVLLLDALATNSLNGARVMTFTRYEDAVTAQTAGYISASTLAAAAAAFAQRPSPREFKVGYVDLVGAETYSSGLTAAIGYDPDFYGVALDTRSQAIQVVVSDAIEASSKPMLLALQDDDASWLDSGAPAGVSAMAGNERTVVYWHSTDAVWSDVASLVNRLSYNPDFKSVPWSGYPVRNVTAHVTPPTATQRGFIIANYVNVGLPYGGEAFVIDPGVNYNNRPVDEIVSSDWFKIRLQERTAALVVQHGARGEKISVTKTGQKKILAIIEGLLKQGVAAGHFVEGQTSAVAEAITSADLTARQLRFTVRAQLAVSGRLFTFDCFFSRDPIADDA